MNQPRFILTPDHFASTPLLLSGPDAHHCHTLRLQVQDQVCVSDGLDREWLARIVRISKQTIELELLESLTRNTESGLTLTLVQGFARGSKLEWVIQKATELGVSRIMPMVSTYSQMKPKEDREHRVDRWHEIARQAVRQSGRIRMPEITAPCSFQQSITERKATALGVLFYEGTSQQENWRSQLSLLPVPQDVVLWVGPEGGFTPAEVSQAQASGIQTVSLGPRILRSETAGIVAVCLAQFVWGDLGGN